MNAKQRVAVYGSMVILFVIGIFFFIKGITKEDSILVLIGIALGIMGLLRFILFKNVVHKHEDE